MKSLNYLFAASAAVLALAACNKVETEPAVHEEAGKTITLTVTPSSEISNADTKTLVTSTSVPYTIEWGLGDKLALYENVDGTLGNRQYSTALASQVATATFSFELTAKSGTLFGYTFVCPADAYSKSSGKYYVTIPKSQTFAADSFDPASDVLVSKYISQATQPTSLQPQFERVGGTALMTLKGISGTEKISSIVITSTGASECLAGRYEVTPTDGTVGTEVTNGNTGITLTPGTATVLDGDVPVWFRTLDVTLTKGFTVVVTTNANKYSKTVDLATLGKSLQFTGGKLTTFTMNLASATVEANQTVAQILGLADDAAVASQEVHVTGLTTKGFVATDGNDGTGKSIYVYQNATPTVR